MARNKGPVFRVTGLPASEPDNELALSLKTTIEDIITEEEQWKPNITVGIVPSCYDNDQKVALVEFHSGVPAFLSELKDNPLGEWQVEMGDTDMSFDQHFFGFTQLYAPKADSPVTADIIAITGLDGHAYGSWRGKGNLGRMWLRDFLSKDLPWCRTMIYGYNSKLSSHGIDTIMDYGRGLIEELKKIRNTNGLRKRPLFFIAHSFGGIILAHCLVKAVQTDEDDHPTIASLYKATYGMLLFGIPHRGLVIEDIQKMLATQDGHPRGVLLDQIKAKSDLLAFQLADFKTLIRDRKVVSFYETGQSRQLEFDSEHKRWNRTGNFITAVETDSALLQLPDLIEEKIPLDADHSMMVKFDTKSQRGYSSARDKLLQFEQDASGVVTARFLRPQNRPNPSLMVPFQRDKMFIGRVDILAELRERFEQEAPQDHARLALIGLGGIGKSQITIEYAYRLRESTRYTWVFWVYAINAARFEQSYRDIAAKVDLPGRNDPNTDILWLVYNWLCDEGNGRWLMIIDNADDDSVFSSSTGPRSGVQTVDRSGEARTLSSFLPQSRNGWILVTSRDRVAALNLVGSEASVTRVEPMGEDDALMLLRTRVSRDKILEEDARLLVQTLECIPLAVTHAAAYMAVRERTTILTYLEIFHESEENQASLLQSSEARDIRRDDSVSDAVITTWQISFEQIRTTKPEAAELLSLMAMFDRQAIPESTLYDGRGRLQFEDAVAPLTSFSLIRSQGTRQLEQRTEEHLFEMHGLVQLATRKWLEAHGQVDRWQTASLRVMAAAFRSGAYETWTECQGLLSHSRKVLSYVPEEEEAVLDRASLAMKTGWYLDQMGEYMAAADFIQDAMIARKRLLGEDHPDTLNSINHFGRVLESKGKYKDAESMQQRALQGTEKVLGPEHKNTLISIGDLGSALEKLGRHEEAELMYRRALKVSKKVLGPEQRTALSILGKLGIVLGGQGKYGEAEMMQWRALHGMERVLGLEHPNALTIINNLGLVLSMQGRYEEAESIYPRAVQGYKKVFGEDHPDTLISMNNLASGLWNQGWLQQAEDLQVRVLETRRRVLGDKHPDTLTAMYNLSLTLESRNQDEKAISLLERCYQLEQEVLGPDHPYTNSSLEWLETWRSRRILSGGSEHGVGSM